MQTAKIWTDWEEATDSKGDAREIKREERERDREGSGRGKIIERKGRTDGWDI